MNVLDSFISYHHKYYFKFQYYRFFIFFFEIHIHRSVDKFLSYLGYYDSRLIFFLYDIDNLDIHQFMLVVDFEFIMVFLNYFSVFASL